MQNLTLAVFISLNALVNLKGFVALHLILDYLLLKQTIESIEASDALGVIHWCAQQVVKKQLKKSLSCGLCDGSVTTEARVSFGDVAHIHWQSTLTLSLVSYPTRLSALALCGICLGYEKSRSISCTQIIAWGSINSE